jgi:Short C-terminal domain
VAFNVWGGREPRVRDGVRGEALAMKSMASPEVSDTSSGGERSTSTSGTYGAWTCEGRFVVRAPGRQPLFVSSRRQMTREKYVIPGLRLPVTVSQSKPAKFRIEWDEVPAIDELIARGDPLFTNPDATRPLLQEAWRAAGIPVPPGPARQEIDGPSARVISFGGAGQSQGLLSNNRKLDVLLSVAIPGQARFGYRWQGKGPWDRILRPGTNIRVLYDPARPREVDIPWDEAGFTFGDLAQFGLAVRDAVKRAPAHDPLDQLKRLGDLHAAGALTDAEFAAEKARVLGQT